RRTARGTAPRRSAEAVRGGCPAARRAGAPPLSRSQIPLRPAFAPCRAARLGLPVPSVRIPPRIASPSSLHARYWHCVKLIKLGALLAWGEQILDRISPKAKEENCYQSRTDAQLEQLLPSPGE